MRKVSKNSKEKLPDAVESKGGTNPRRRKSKGSHEERSKPELQNVRQRKRTQVVDEIPRSFDVNTLRSGDRFTFLAPGKGKKTYICTVEGYNVLFERNDNHKYTRPLSDLQSIIKLCNLECVLLNG